MCLVCVSHLEMKEKKVEEGGGGRGKREKREEGEGGCERCVGGHWLLVECLVVVTGAKQRAAAVGREGVRKRRRRVVV